MNKRIWSLLLLCLLLLAGTWLFWPGNASRRHDTAAAQPRPPAAVTATRSASTAPVLFATGKTATNAAAKPDPFAYRLTNTRKSLIQLMADPHALLLANALIDSASPLNFSIPKNLQAQGDPGAWIVQAAGPISPAFRAALAAAGAQIVAYIPNNAYLVTVPAGGAAALASRPGVQSVNPYEPYYKLNASLLGLAVNNKNLPENTALTLGLFPNTAAQTLDQVKQLGATVLGTDSSPFGPVLRVMPPKDWTALAALPGVQIMEVAHHRALANDLARVTLAISADTTTNVDYMNLYGSNVLVEVNDTGIDATHPDFTYGNTAESASPPATPPSGLSPLNSRIIPDSALSIVDTNGHGTHVAGIIAGNGWESYNVATVPQGSVPQADFRGKAPAANLYSVAALNNTGSLDISDSYLQAAPALTNALISNNSWTYVGDNLYDLAAASYDAAVRDALPLVTGSQPVLFVFAAGNDGGGNDDGTGGDAETILSPATAKNVITVGALEQSRNITNLVTTVSAGVTNQNPVWGAATDNPNQVAGYSGRGNVGIGSEGAFGRFKPDVVAPGSFVVSTRSSEWDQAAYYNPTNYYSENALDQFVDPLSHNNYSLSLNFVPPNVTLNSNVVGIDILITPNANSPVPFPPLSIYVSSVGYPNPANPGSYDFLSTSNEVSIPPDGGPSYLSKVQGGNLFFSVVNTNSQRVSYDIYELITATNQNGDYFTVLSNLNDSIGPWYRYESGTSMAAPAVSGTLALIQDYFTNTLHATPSPALLKAMLINGARPVGNYTYNITNNVNFEGWGQPNLPNSVPPGLNNRISVPCSAWFVEQSSTNALATGDSQTFQVNVDTNSFGQLFPLRVTLAWTDPPGNPAAAIKLVNSLTLVVSNKLTGEVFFGNDIAPNTTFNSPWNTNVTPNVDVINNVQNIILPPNLGSSYSITVIGRSVNVNAVTAQTNNTVQDYALLVACGEGEVTNAITVFPAFPLTASNPTGDQDITVVGVNANGMATNSEATGGVFLNQLVGANTPLLGTNTVDALSNYTSTAVVTVGMTNQWHFYVVPNNTSFSNAAFVTFLPDTLSMPRMGVFADPTQNPTQPEADIDMYVSTDPSLTNLNPVVISNCINGTQVGISAGGTFNGASVSGGGTEYVVDTGSKAGQVYYIGIKSETSIASEYGFLPVFSLLPFSTVKNGVETVNGLLLPQPIPDGSPAHPGTRYVFALAIQPIQVQDLVVSNQILHQRFGDLVGTLSHNNKKVVLNSHNTPINPPEPGPYTFNYYDGPQPPQTTAALNSQKTDGPGSLTQFQGQQGTGPWMLTEVDDSLTQTGAVTGLTLTITPHQDLTKGIYVSIPGHAYYYGYIDVPVGTTNLTIAATNVSGIVTPGGDFTGTLLDTVNPGVLYEKLGEQPAPPPTPLTNYDKTAVLNLGSPPGNVITVGRSDIPTIQPGRYYVTLYNASATPQEYYIIATLGIGQAPPGDFTPVGSVPLLDNAVSYAYITNYPGPSATNETIDSIAVGIRVDHPRISDLVFTLISPDGSRYLLMQNRGGTSTNGAGATIQATNLFSGNATGGPAGATNIYDLHATSGTIPIAWNFYTVPDTLDVYYQGNLIFSTGLVSGTGSNNIAYGPGASTQIEVVVDATNHPPSTLWTYTLGNVQSNFVYLTFTDDTNLTTTPIKYAPTPFVPDILYPTNGFADDFEGQPAATYPAGSTFNSWTVLTNQVSVVTDTNTAYSGSNFLALASGVISNNLPTIAGQTYTLSFAYRGPDIISLWTGDAGLGVDSVGTNNGTPFGTVTIVPAKVRSGFQFNGSSYLDVPNSPSLNLTNSFTLEMWYENLNPASGGYGLIGKRTPNPPCNFGINIENPQGLGVFYNDPAYTSPGNNSDDAGEFETCRNPVVPSSNVFHHVAGTFTQIDATHVQIHDYLDGQLVRTKLLLGNLANTLSLNDVLIGTDASSGEFFTGILDEVSIYHRALSVSEINAIYNLGSAGKYDTASEFPINLAEATVSVPGGGSVLLSGANTNWQTYTTTFVATQNGTPLVFTGVEPGMLLDAVSLTQAPTGTGLYYQPEQSLITGGISGNGLIGTSGYGLWTLEIQDDRVGATNNAVLDSWQLQFVFADTNPVPYIPPPVILIPGSEICPTNPTPTNSISWFQVNVPLNATFATNTLFSATAPVNLLFNQTTPDTNGALVLLTNLTAGVSVLSTTNGVPPLIPGSTYYLGVQNLNSIPVNFCIGVSFNLLTTAYAYTEPAQLVTGTSAQLNGFATPNGFPATAWFQWGTNTLYGNQTAQVGVGVGYNVVYTTSTIFNLVTNVPYHFRLVVSNALGVAYGFDQILDEANVVAWGPNYAGQLIAPTNQNITAIAGAYNHNLALTTNGQVLAWGDNAFGQTTVPAAFSNLVAVAVAGGQYYSMALLSGGTVTAWGAPFLNQTNVPAGLNGVVTIAGGTVFSLALKSDGTVAAWGANFSGVTSVPASVSNIVAVAGGGYHSLALRNDGTVTAWGENGSGQTNVPAGLNNIAAIAAGGLHSLALKYDGTVVAWGDNSDGQTNVPAGLTNVAAIAAGGFNSLALKTDGTVVTWGDNTAGQSSVPVGLTNMVAISAGYLHSLALTPQTLISTNPFILTLLPGVAQTNNILGNSITYYRIDVPTNADFATNTLFFATNGTLNIWYSTNTPPTLNATNATLLGGNVASGTWILSTNGVPPLVPGSTYYLGVQNLNSYPLTYAVRVDFHYVTPPPTVFTPSIIFTNGGYLLTWFAPSNDLFLVQWSTNLPPVWNTFTNIVSFNPAAFTGGPLTQFNFFDDGSQTGGLTPVRFYNLILLGSLSNLTNGSPQTNTIPPGGYAYYSVAVPPTADFATNLLLSATAPVNLLFNQVTPPTGAGAGDLTLLNNLTGGTSVLSGTSAPPLLPGATYYLAVQNTNSFAVTAAVQVNFHLATAPVVPTPTVIFTNGGYLLTWFAPSNELFQLQWGGSLPPVWSTFTNIISFNPAAFTGGPLTQFNFFDDGSQTGGLTPVRFYNLILLGSLSSLTNALPQTNAIPPGGYAYYAITVPAAADFATNLLLSAGAPVNLLFNQATPPTGVNTGDFTLLNLALTGSTNLSAGSVPPLVPGATYYLAVQNPNSFPVTAAVQVNFHLATLTFPVIYPVSSVTYSSGNFVLNWLAPTNDIFTVQVATSLSAPAWQTIASNVTYSGPVTNADGLFTYTDTGSVVPFGPIRFYQLLLTGVTPPAISGLTLTTNGLTLTWSAPTNDQFQVAWATNLIPPVAWTPYPGLLTSTNGSFSFTDTNAPLLIKFYELILLP